MAIENKGVDSLVTATIGAVILLLVVGFIAERGFNTPLLAAGIFIIQKKKK